MQEAQKRKVMSSKVAAWAVAVLGLGTVGVLWASVDATTRSDSAQIIQAIREQVDLLKWVGGSMVSGLVIAVGWLWTALNKERQDAKSMVEKSTLADEHLADAVTALKEELCRRPCIVKKD